MIVDETVRQIREGHGDLLASERIEKLVIGVAFTAVRLSGGSCGLAGTDLARDLLRPFERRRRPADLAPGRWQGRPVLDVLDRESDWPLFDGVKLAVLNALSARVVVGSAYRIETGRDALEWIDASAGRAVTLVGAFPSYMEKLSTRPCTLRILERDAEAVPEPYRALFVPADRAAEVLPKSDAVIVTGSTLVNRTLDDLLSLISPTAFTALVGPSGGLLPDPLFRRGVDVIGTIRILDPETMFTIVGEAGSSFHLFGTCAEKICILRA